MTPERCIENAVRRAVVVWSGGRIVGECGAIVFRDLDPSTLPVQAYTDGQAFSVEIVVTRRHG